MDEQELKEKIYKKYKGKIVSQIKIASIEGRAVKFTLRGFSEVYNITMNNAPKWFKEFEKKNDSRWDRQEKFNEAVVKFIDDQKEFNKKQLSFNGTVTNFMKEQNVFNKKQLSFNENHKH